MGPRDRPWRDHAMLRALAADWRLRLRGRRVAGLGGGPGWLRLTMTDAREGGSPGAHLFFSARPGAVALWDAREALPTAMREALLPVRQKELSATAHLLGAELDEVSVPPEDRIVRLHFRRPDDSRPMLAMQLFGPRGNVVLSDSRGRRIWSANPSPHSASLEAEPRDPRIEEIGEEPAADAAEIFRRVAPLRLQAALAAEALSRLNSRIARAADAAARLRANLAKDLKRAESGELDRRRGETLAIHLHELRRGESRVELADAAGEMLAIEMDPALTPAENMDRCFHRARKAERGRQLITDRLAAAETRAAELEALAAAARATAAEHAGDELGLLAAIAELRRNEPELLGEAKQQRRGPAAAEAVSAPYRSFIIEGKWEVRVGRGAKENDELTHKASSPRDLWLHAQGVSGSHVILRTKGDPQQVPKRIIELAARIAAHFSKARHSGLAPVVCTERRYVRKPRKSPPGTAACIREKSLMVEPGIPDRAERVG